jgi:hypothetical protein
MHYTEFELQAIAYVKLRNKFKNVRGEYKYKVEGKRGARFDIVILNDNDEIELIIEVKRNPNSKATSQKERYEELINKPCIYIKGYEEAYNAVEIVTNNFNLQHLFKKGV